MNNKNFKLFWREIQIEKKKNNFQLEANHFQFVYSVIENGKYGNPFQRNSETNQYSSTLLQANDLQI